MFIGSDGIGRAVAAFHLPQPTPARSPQQSVVVRFYGRLEFVVTTDAPLFAERTLVLMSQFEYWVAFLLSPPISPGQKFDLRAYYFRQVRWAAWLFGLSLAILTVSRVTSGADALFSPINAIRPTALCVLFSIGLVKHPRVHKTFVLVIACLLLSSILIG